MLHHQDLLLIGAHYQVKIKLNPFYLKILELKGLQKWIDRMGWVVSTYVEQRQKFQNNNKLDLEVEKMLNNGYNYFVRYVIIS